MKTTGSKPVADQSKPSAVTLPPVAPFADTRYNRHRFSFESVNQDAPDASGVYGLFGALWIYIGEADNIRKRLLEHLSGDNPCVTHYRPSGFAFELLPAEERVARKNELAIELQPLCQGALFAYKSN